MIIGKIFGTVLVIAGMSTIKAGERPVYFEDFEGPKPLGEWVGWGGDTGGIGKVKISSGVAHGGRKAAAFQYDFTGIKPQGGVYCRCRVMRTLPGQPLRLIVWVYGDNNGRSLQYRIQDATGRVWQSDLGKVDWNGWRRIDSKFNPKACAWGGKPAADGNFVYPLSFVEFLITGDKPGEFKNKGTIYIDDLGFLETAKDEQTF